MVLYYFKSHPIFYTSSLVLNTGEVNNHKIKYTSTYIHCNLIFKIIIHL